jgi:hypothetical protein
LIYLYSLQIINNEIYYNLRRIKWKIHQKQALYQW